MGTESGEVVVGLPQGYYGEGENEQGGAKGKREKQGKKGKKEKREKGGKGEKGEKKEKRKKDKKDRKDKRDKKPKLLHFDCNFQEQRLGLGLAEPGPHQPTQHIWLQFISKDATEAIAQGVCVGDVVAEVAGIPVLGCTQIQLVSIIGAQKRPVQIRFARLPYT